jgi:hypothetical protein
MEMIGSTALKMGFAQIERKLFSAQALNFMFFFKDSLPDPLEERPTT